MDANEKKARQLGAFIETYPNMEIVRLRKRFFKKCGLLFHCIQMHELVALFETANKGNIELDKWYYLNKLAIAHNGYKRKIVLAKDKRIFLNLKHEFYNVLVKGIENGKYKKEYDELQSPLAFIWYVAHYWRTNLICG